MILLRFYLISIPLILLLISSDALRYTAIANTFHSNSQKYKKNQNHFFLLKNPAKQLANITKSINNFPGRNKQVEIERLTMPANNAEAVVTALIAALQDENAEVRSSAALALGRMGTPALSAKPFLVKMLEEDREGMSVVMALGWFGSNAEDTIPAIGALLSDALYGDYSSHIVGVALENIGSKALRYQLDNILRNTDEEAAAKILRVIGSGAKELVPVLIDLLQDTTTRYKAADILAAIGPDAKEALPTLIKILKDNDPQARNIAISAIAAIGPDAKEAIPALLELLQNTESASEAAEALVAIKTDAETDVPVLVKLLNNPDTLEYAIQVLEAIGPEAQAAVPFLIKIIKTSPNIEHQRKAILAVGAIGANDNETTAMLTQSLQKPELQSAAAIALVRLRSDTLLAVNTLSSNLHDENDWLRLEKVIVLGDIGAEAQAAVPTLISLLKYECLKYEEENDPPAAWINENHELCANTVATLASIGSSAIPNLIELLKDEDQENRSLATITLAKIGSEAESAIPALVIALQDNDEYVRRFAAAALGKIGVEALPALFEAVQSQNATTRELAASALGDVGNQATPGLIKILNGGKIEVRRSTISALSQIGADAKSVLPEIIDALGDKDVAVRNTAAITLGRIGPDAQSAVPALIKALKDSEPMVRSASAATLRQIGSNAQSAIPALIEALKDSEPMVRSDAVAAIGTINPGIEVNPTLIAALRDRNPEVRRNAATALGEINSEIKVEPSILIGAFGDPNWEVRRNATEQLVRIGSKTFPALREALRDNSPLIRRSAAYTLLRLTPESGVVLPELLKALGDEDIGVLAFTLFAIDNIFFEIEGNNPQFAFSIAEAYLRFFSNQDDSDPDFDRPTVCYILRAIDSKTVSRLHLSCETGGRAWYWVGRIFNRRSRR
jgi:HEAT repeat protein